MLPKGYGLPAFNAFNQLICDIGTFNTHDAFLSAAVTQKIYASIPYDFLIHDGKFLMNIGFKDNTNEPVSKRFSLVKLKADKNFNHRNTLSI